MNAAPAAASAPSTRRLRLAGWHLCASAVVASLAALLVFRVWYPPPYDALAGGTHLFVLLVAVDVVIGPLLTAVVAAPAKPRRELARDLAVIVALQLAAFGYGIATVAQARPVALVHEIDLLRVVSAADLDDALLARAPEALRRLSWTGPRRLLAVKPKQADLQLESIQLSVHGIPLAMQPQHWRDASGQAPTIWASARPVAELLARYPDAAPQVDAIAREAGLPASSLRFLPLLARRAAQVALIEERDARLLGTLARDGQF